MSPISLLLIVAPQVLVVSDLKCESAALPMNVDVRQPYLSWIVSSPEEGQRQSGYRILISTSHALLAANKGDLWDTAKVNSNATIDILYKGRPLRSSETVFWKVRVWDVNDNPSKWSAENRWKMGVLSPTGGSSHSQNNAGTRPTGVFRCSNELLSKSTQVADMVGIKPDPQGTAFSRIIIQPRPVPDVSWAEGAYDSVRGRITCSWKRSGDRFHMEVTIPANTTATVFMPSKPGASVRIAYPATKSFSVMVSQKQQDGYEPVPLPSGRYVLDSILP